MTILEKYIVEGSIVRTLTKLIRPSSRVKTGKNKFRFFQRLKTMRNRELEDIAKWAEKHGFSVSRKHGKIRFRDQLFSKKIDRVNLQRKINNFDRRMKHYEKLAKRRNVAVGVGGGGVALAALASGNPREETDYTSEDY